MERKYCIFQKKKKFNLHNIPQDVSLVRERSGPRLVQGWRSFRICLPFSSFWLESFDLISRHVSINFSSVRLYRKARNIDWQTDKLQDTNVLWCTLQNPESCANNMSVFIRALSYTEQTTPLTKTWHKDLSLWNQVTACGFLLMDCNRVPEVLTFS